MMYVYIKNDDVSAVHRCNYAKTMFAMRYVKARYLAARIVAARFSHAESPQSDSLKIKWSSVFL